MAYRIPRDSWGIIERVIRRYPESKRELEIYENDIIYSSPENDGQPKGTGVGDPTARKAEKLMSDARVQRLHREVDAVESVYNLMIPEHQKVVRVRFWSNRWRNMNYSCMENPTSYSSRQMIRICYAFIRKVGEKLGEV